MPASPSKSRRAAKPAIELPDILLAYRLHDRSICWDRERDQYPMWQALLAETYARRGIDQELPKIRPRSQRGGRLQAVQRTWIRTAARHGYLKTALKHARQLIQQEPLAPGTWWTLARAAASYVR